MAKGQLFEYAVLYHPKPSKAQLDAGTTPKSEVLLEPKSCLATSKDQVAILAARAVPQEFVDKLDEIEIIVRPF